MELRIGISDAAKYLNRTTKQLQRWDNDGVLPAHKTSGGNRYYYRNELELMKTLLSGMTREDVASLLHVSEKTLWRWDKSGKFKHRYMVGNTPYYDRADVERYLALKEGVHNEIATI